jgi:cobalt-zinc-cadmium efflux system protein
MSAAHSHGAGGHAHGGHSQGGHAHGAGRAANRKRLMLVLALSATYMVAEVVGGLVTNSLALLADAGHMLSDVAALALSLFAIWIAERPPTPTRTYGYYRTEILAALANGVTLVAISVFIFLEAWERFRAPPEVQGGLMMGIAAGGLAVNLLGLWILNAGRGESLNVRGAWLHVATDALGSVGAIVGGALIYALGWAWADPAVSVLIGLLVIYSSWGLLKETVAVLMEGAPGQVDVDAVRDAMRAVPSVTAVHDLHVWSITSGMVALSAHVCVADGPGARPMADVLRDLRRSLHDRFGIDHATVQFEPEGFREVHEGTVHA